MTSDLELMTAFRHGDSGAFIKLVRRHHLNLYNFLHALVRSEGVAEHLTHETFLRAYVDRSELSPSLGFSLSMLRIASFCWLDYCRRTSAQTLPAVSSSTVPPAPSEEADLIRHFENLPPELRLVLAMGEVQGLSYAEIGRVLEIAPETVRRRVADAYARLRNQMLPLRAPPVHGGSGLFPSPGVS